MLGRFFIEGRKLKEIIWHGRGGQGAFTAARLLGAAAALNENTFSLAFPSFGPERRGAPMRAFVKIDDAKVGDRSEIEKADYVVYLDETLYDEASAKSQLKDGGKILVNSSCEHPGATSIDASGISTEILGRNIPNTVFVGWLCKDLGIKTCEEAIRENMPAKLVDKNIEAVKKAASLA